MVFWPLIRRDQEEQRASLLDLLASARFIVVMRLLHRIFVLEWAQE